jgi:hypothetical protein
MNALVSPASLCVLLCAGSIATAQVYGAQPCDASVKYENHNMIDYTVKVRNIKGTVIDEANVSLPRACIAVFNADHSKLLHTAESDAEGKFVIKKMSPGQYWLVVKDQQRAFCPVAAKLEVARWRSKRELVVHVVPGGIDRCSYCDAK